MKWLRMAWYDLWGMEDEVGPRTKEEKRSYRTGVALLCAGAGTALAPVTGGLSLLLLLVSLRKIWIMWKDQ